MSFPRYPKYKASGVEWLGEVPEKWGTFPLKYLATIKTGYAFSSDDFVGEGIPVLRIGDITTGGTIDFSSARYLPNEYGAKHPDVLAIKGDIVMAMTGATIGKAGRYLEEQPALLNQRVCIFRSTQINSQHYLWYILNTGFYAKHISLAAVGGAQPNISDSELLRCGVPVPPLAEQTVIAAFLDRETGKIDGLVTEQKRLMELLKEKRQAVISHAVTKGLNPNAKMKPSGVEWLGDVPEGWEVKRLKYNLHLLTEKTDRREHPVALENIEGWTGRFISTETEFQGEGVAFDAGDILFGKLRPYLAKAYRAESSGEAVGDFHVLRPIATINSRFAQYQILNREFIAIVDGSTFGSKMPRASWEFVGGMRVTAPPLAEQTAIAEFLDRETANIDTLTAEAQRAIDLLQERRTALISAAVTGQIDVRKINNSQGV